MDGAHTPLRSPRGWIFALTALAAASATGCGGDESQTLEAEAFSMTDAATPFYDDGELTLYQSQLPVQLPILAPDETQRANLGGPLGPFPREPWVTTSDIRVQVSWTLVNTDEETHSVKVLFDPWNEFGRYVPGFTQDGDEAIPNFSGIENLYVVPGTASGESPRIHHTFTFADMEELAADFATAINIIEVVEPPPPEDGEDDPRPVYVNHTFAIENRQGETPLTDRYLPSATPALTGFDVAIRTEAPVNVAMELIIEIVDLDGERVRERGENDPLLEMPTQTYTVGG